MRGRRPSTRRCGFFWGLTPCAHAKQGRPGEQRFRTYSTLPEAATSTGISGDQGRRLHIRAWHPPSPHVEQRESDTPGTRQQPRSKCDTAVGMSLGRWPCLGNQEKRTGSCSLAWASACEARSPTLFDGAGGTGTRRLQNEAGSRTAKRRGRLHAVVSEQAQDCRERSCEIMYVGRAVPRLARSDRGRPFN